MSAEPFCKLYKWLFKGPYKELSPADKLAYTLIRDRIQLSEINDFYDDRGIPCAVYTTSEMGELLTCTRQTAGKIIDNLEAVNLIYRREKINGRGCYIYLKDNSALLKKQTMMCENNYIDIGGSFNTSNNYHNKKSFNNTSSRNVTDNRNEEMVNLLNRWDYRHIIAISEQHEKIANSVFNVAVDIMCHSKKNIHIAGDIKETDFVKYVILQLTSKHIICIIDRLLENTTTIKNDKAYIQAALYNSGLALIELFKS